MTAGCGASHGKNEGSRHHPKLDDRSGDRGCARECDGLLYQEPKNRRHHGRERPRLSFTPPEPEVRSLIFSDDGSFLAAAGEQGSIQLWHTSTTWTMANVPNPNRAVSADGNAQQTPHVVPTFAVSGRKIPDNTLRRVTKSSCVLLQIVVICLLRDVDALKRA